ncbi:MAG: hypothetical protein KF901_24565 [Myxococcales bacterium]|nr:hypothetical protein [Myxococcales bacterium]
MTRSPWLLLLALALACGDDDTTLPADGGADGSAATDSGGRDADLDPDGAVLGLCPAGDALLDPLPGTPRFVVVGSDYTSTSVSILDEDGAILADSWITSGTTAPGLVTTLSGDVVIPTQVLAGTVGLIDRFMTDVLSLWCADGSLVGQLRVRPATGSFSPNPQDFLILDESTGWATRADENLDPEASALDRGGDLYGFDPRTMSDNGRRVSFTEFNGVVSGLDAEGGSVEVPTHARPGRMLQIGEHVLVVLSRLQANLFGSDRGADDGVVVAVDTSDDSVRSVTLTGLRNCGSIAPVPAAPRSVMVACAGWSNVGFADEAGARATAGIVRLEVAEDGALTETLRWEVASDAESLRATSGLIALDAERVLGVAAGNFVDQGDRLVETHLGTGAQRVVLEADGSFVLGSGARVGTTIFVPDASEPPTVRRLNAELVEGTSLQVGPATLPPRAIRAL